MAGFFKREIVVNRSCEELLSELSAKTINLWDIGNYGKKGEFRGDVWQNGFRIALNTSFWNSFESIAEGRVEPSGDRQCIVSLTIGPGMSRLIVMCFWNLVILVTFVTVSASAFSDGIAKGFATMLIFVPFIAVDVVFLRYCLYANYKKVKEKILDFLVYKEECR